jgi:hypothetical protein
VTADAGGAVGIRSRLFTGLVDDAGLFPPERLPMDAAVTRHRTDAAAGHPVLTQRFLVPTSGLRNLRGQLGRAERWRVGLIVDTALDGLDDLLLTVAADPRLLPETVEVQLPAGEEPAQAVERIAALAAGRGPTVHVEISPALPGWETALGAVADGGLGAKVRCGGLEAAAFPSADDLAAFVTAAAASGVPFKATAGLHHAVRYRDQVTGFTHHGFLNLLLAVCRAVAGRGRAEVAAVLTVDDGGMLAEEARAVAPDTVARARSLFLAYGSCSTSEPIDDLAGLGLVAGSR